MGVVNRTRSAEKAVLKLPTQFVFSVAGMNDPKLLSLAKYHLVVS
jgi:hypothetical protein